MLVGSTGFIGCRYLLNDNNIVYCEHKKTEKTTDNNFDWNKLLSYLSPDVFSLLAAIAVSILIIILIFNTLYCVMNKAVYYVCILCKLCTKLLCFMLCKMCRLHLLLPYAI